MESRKTRRKKKEEKNMYPFDLHGPEFISLYVASTVAATAGAAVYRNIKSNTGTACEAHPLYVALDPYEIAYLRGGKKAVLDAVLATLVQSGVIAVEGENASVRDDAKVDSHPVVSALRSKLFLGTHSSETMKVALKRWKDEPLQEFDALREKLERAGYILREDFSKHIAAVSAAIMLSPLIIGVPKLLIGLSIGKPVTFLVLLLFINAIFAVAFLCSKPLRTGKGDAAMQTLSKQNATLKTNAAANPNALNPMQVATVAALFGPAVFTLGMLGDFNRKIVPPQAYGGGCGSGSSCGGGSCGGGCGGGCGGCGG
jgi:uncharacterized protein (TIGR04222 family)